MVDINNATGIYSNALEIAKKGPSAQENNNGPSFGDVLKSSLDGAIQAQHRSESVSASAVAGQANITDVIQAVTEAEMKLNTVVAIRDRVIAAYQQIMRSPI